MLRAATSLAERCSMVGTVKCGMVQYSPSFFSIKWAFLASDGLQMGFESFKLLGVLNYWGC